MVDETKKSVTVLLRNTLENLKKLLPLMEAKINKTKENLKKAEDDLDKVRHQVEGLEKTIEEMEKSEEEIIM